MLRRYIIKAFGIKLPVSGLRSRGECSRFAFVAASLLAVALLEPMPACAEGTAATIYTTASLEWAFGTDGGDTQKLELTLEPRLEAPLVRGIELTTIVRLRADAFDELDPGGAVQEEVSPISRSLLIGDRSDLALRELYIETALGSAYLKLGKQQIVWGRADVLKVLDIVNPQDFREFILDEFLESRIPLWAANLEIPVGAFDLQLLWIPDQTYNEIPPAGALFEFTASTVMPTAPPGFLLDIERVRRPDRFFADSDAGMEISTLWKGWDLTLNYMFHYYDVPVIYRHVERRGDRATIVVTPGYERTHLLGGTFSNAFGELTVRGEVGVSFDRFFSTNRVSDEDGVIRTDELAYVLGLDWFGLEETMVSLQVFQSYLTSDPRGLIRDDLTTTVTLFLRRALLNDTLVVSAIWLQDLTIADGLVRPKIGYALRDDLEVWAGADVFYGSASGLYGEFGRNDRLVAGLAVTF